jgi:hypothetical protein
MFQIKLQIFQIVIIWVVTLCSSVRRYQRFEEYTASSLGSKCVE